MQTNKNENYNGDDNHMLFKIYLARYSWKIGHKNKWKNLKEKVISFRIHLYFTSVDRLHNNKVLGFYLQRRRCYLYLMQLLHLQFSPHRWHQRSSLLQAQNICTEESYRLITGLAVGHVQLEYLWRNLNVHKGLNTMDHSWHTCVISERMQWNNVEISLFYQML